MMYNVVLPLLWLNFFFLMTGVEFCITGYTQYAMMFVFINSYFYHFFFRKLVW